MIDPINAITKENQESQTERLRRTAKDQIAATSELLNVLQPSNTCDRIACDARDRLADEIAETPDIAQRACQAGCSACCHSATVDVTPLEAIHIANYIRQNFSEKEIAIKQEKVAVNAKLNQQLSNRERKHARIACAMLDENGSCSIYSARPLTCAGIFSLSKNACKEAFENKDSIELKVPLDQTARAAVMGISGGLQRALVNSKIDGNLYELHSVLNRALEYSNAEQQMLAGKDVFKGCVCTDRHSAPRLRVDKPSVPKPKMIHQLLSEQNQRDAHLSGPVRLPVAR